MFLLGLFHFRSISVFRVASFEDDEIPQMVPWSVSCKAGRDVCGGVAHLTMTSFNEELLNDVCLL